MSERGDALAKRLSERLNGGRPGGGAEPEDGPSEKPAGKTDDKPKGERDQKPANNGEGRRGQKPPEKPAEETATGSVPEDLGDSPEDSEGAKERPVKRLALSPAEERRLLHRVNAAGGKLAAVHRDLTQAENMWELEVAEARNAGLDESKLTGAALILGVDLPPPPAKSRRKSHRR